MQPFFDDTHSNTLFCSFGNDYQLFQICHAVKLGLACRRCLAFLDNEERELLDHVFHIVFRTFLREQTQIVQYLPWNREVWLIFAKSDRCLGANVSGHKLTWIRKNDSDCYECRQKMRPDIERLVVPSKHWTYSLHVSVEIDPVACLHLFQT